MEENQETYPAPAQPTSNGINFPSIGDQPQKSSGSKIFLILGLLVVVGAIGFLIFKNSSSSENSETVEEQPFITDSPVQTTQPSATASSKPVDKTKIKIEIQNGTGVTGEAAYLQTQLKSLSYTNFIVGNAESQNQTSTTVTFSKTLSQSIVDELTTKLKDIYKTVEVNTSSTIKTDVLIVTGLKKGATSKPSATPTSKATSTSTATPTASSSN